MHSSLQLTRQRLESLQRILHRNPQGITLRNLHRCHWVFRNEVEEAAKLGFVTLTKRKPHAGRPSLIVTLSVNKPDTTKLPPTRWQIGPPIRHRHWLFAINSDSIVSSRGPFGWDVSSKVAAYRKVYRNASYASARAGASRLIKHPDVRACLRWLYAQVNRIVPIGENMPSTAFAIHARLDKLERQQQQ